MYLDEDAALHAYSFLLNGRSRTLAETRYPYDYLSERHLQAMWLEQKYFKNLTTSDGQPIAILSPGIWNAEAGPDFKKAHLKIGERDVKGDVEIHLSDEGWTHHKHHLDLRYDEVVLHLSLWKPKQEEILKTFQGRPLIKAYFENALTISHTRILKLIDLELYPYKKFVGSGKCAQQLFQPLSEEKIKHLFYTAADWRLAQKRAFLKLRMEDRDLLVGSGIATALGYKHNSEAFFELFILLMKHRRSSQEEVLAAGMGICGFFEESYLRKWKDSAQHSKLFEIYKARSDKSAPSISLALNQIRPLNHPIRRLAYLSHLITDPQLEKLHDLFETYWQQNWRNENTKGKWAALRTGLKNLLPDYPDAYWNHHFIFEKNPANTFLPLIGDDLKTEILVNTLLPLLHQSIMKRKDPIEIKVFHTLYTSIPASKNRKTNYLTHRFFGDTYKGELLKNACAQQGAFQLHHDFCVHYEASCEGCPFVDNYNKIFHSFVS